MSFVETLIIDLQLTVLQLTGNIFFLKKPIEVNSWIQQKENDNSFYRSITNY